MNDGYLLKLENISKSFPGVKALKGVNFDLMPNERKKFLYNLLDFLELNSALG